MGDSDIISSPVRIGRVAKRPRFLPGAEESRYGTSVDMLIFDERVKLMDGEVKETAYIYDAQIVTSAIEQRHRRVLITRPISLLVLIHERQRPRHSPRGLTVRPSGPSALVC